MISFSDAWLNLVNVFKSFRPTDVLDILITSFLVYKLITWAKVTRTGQLVKGLLALVVAYFLADWMQLQTMKYAMQYLFSNGLILLAVIFQPELRTALERVGPQPDFPAGIVFASGRKVGGSTVESGYFGDLRSGACPFQAENRRAYGHRKKVSLG